MIHLHRWSKWTPSKHYIDTSWRSEAHSTLLTRRCHRCGLVQSKGIYGVTIPLEEQP